MNEVIRGCFRNVAFTDRQRVIIDQIMLALLDLEMAKVAVPGQDTAIDGFRVHADALVTSYGAVLESCNNAEDRIRGEFLSKIENKNKLIKDLHKKIEDQGKAVISF